MPNFQINVHNEDFNSLSEEECASNEEALRQALKTALAIASEEVSAGKPFFGAEVMLSEGNKQLIRYVVAVGASPLRGS